MKFATIKQALIVKQFYFAMLAIIGAGLLAGCITPTPAPAPAKRQAAFIESEFAPYAGVGISTVTGQAFLKTRSGEVRFGAGCEVQMAPVTSYTTEFFERSMLSYELLETPDPRYAAFRRTTIADGNGNFEFLGVPAGSYYLTCVIEWEYVTEHGLTKTGGTALGKTTVAVGETAKVILTK